MLSNDQDKYENIDLKSAWEKDPNRMFVKEDDNILGFDESLPGVYGQDTRGLLDLNTDYRDKLVSNDSDSGVIKYQVHESAISDVIEELKYVNQDIRGLSKKTKQSASKWAKEINQWGNFVGDVVDRYVSNYYDMDKYYRMPKSINLLELEYRIPEYSVKKLQTLINQSPVLRQCIRAMTANVVGNGYTIGYRENVVNEKGKEHEPEVVAEKSYLKTVVEQINPEMTLFDLLQRVADDYYNYGYFFVGVRRNPRNMKEIIELFHVPAPQVRILKYEDKQIDESILLRGKRKIPVRTHRSYKRYVQEKPVFQNGMHQTELSTELEFFVEVGSKALIDSRTGMPLPEELSGSPISALEIFHGRSYDPTSSYGKPVWLNQLSAVVGQIEADSLNLQNFTQNLIPQLLLLVSNMAMARSDIGQLESMLNSNKAKNSNRRNKAVVLRGVTSNPRIVDPEHANVRDAGMSVVKLNDAENKELLFGNYDKQCSDRIRSAFRLPPIIVGLTDDYNKATSVTSLKVAEQQVFALERKFFEDIFNNKLLTDANGDIFKNVKISLSISSIEDKESEALFLESMSRVGALTPNMALTEYNKFTGSDYQLFPEDWANRPIALSELMLQQAFSASNKGFNYDPMSGDVSGVEGFSEDKDE